MSDANTYSVKDAGLRATKSLPNGVGEEVSAGLDLEISANGSFLGGAEFFLTSPALTTAQLPDANTMKYDLYHDTASDFSSETKLVEDALIVTGAGGAGAAKTEQRTGIPSDVKRYVRFKASNDGIGDASPVSATLELVY